MSKDAAADSLEPTSRARRIFSLLIKITLTATALALVFSRVDAKDIWQHIRTIPPQFVVLGWLSLFLSQLTGVFRTRYYFHKAGHELKLSFCFALYFSGATVNLILPGGISGDGYKALFLKKHKKIPALRALRLILSERANGLFLLLLLAIIFIGMSGILNAHTPYAVPLLILSAIALFAGYVVSARLFLKEKFTTLLGACRFSTIGQTMIALAAFFIFHAMGLEAHIMEYLAVFMISNVVAIFPISIGGAGMRELTFYYSALWLGLSVEQSVAASLIFFGIHTTVSLVGLFFIHNLKEIASR